MTDLPPFGDETDEAVSASIDGELEDFATAHGLTTDEVSRRLAAWPGFEARRRELGGARGAVATQLPRLGAPTRRQLVHEALLAGGSRPGAERRRRRARVWRQIAAVAAGILVVVAAGFGLSRLGGGSASSSSKSSKSSSAAAPHKVEQAAYVGDVGDVSDPTALRTVLTTRLAQLPAHAPEASTGSSASSGPNALASPVGDGRDTALRCAAVVDPGLSGASPDTVVLLATARFQGHDVVVIGVRRGTRSIVFVADRASCAVLTSQSV